MLKLRSISIRHKLTGAFLVAVVIATALSAISAAWRETEQRFKVRREALLAIASTLASSIAEPVVRGDAGELRVRLNAIRSMPSIKFAIVVDKSGRRLHEIGNGIILSSKLDPLVANQELGIFTTLRLGTYLVSQPVIRGGEHVGHLSLIADVSELRSALAESAVGALAAGALAAAVGVLVSLWLGKGILGPIVALTDATDAIRRSANYEARVASTSQDETGRLVATFNAMLQEIQQRDAALRDQRDRLADEVQLRTRELVTAKEVAEQANAAKSDFLATMSHEIRTPMNGMLVMAELLASEAMTPRARRHCDVILKSGQTLLAVINDILDLSKIEAGHMHLERVACDPASIVEDVALLFSERAHEAGIELACQVDRNVPETILSDPLRLRQILSNFVGNALKFTQEGGVLVRLGAVERDGRLHLRYSVRDSGIGIPEDRLGALFEAFTQADASTTRRFGGTGIGLTICKRLATAFGGDIEVESTVGTGSTFTLDVPVEIEAGGGALDGADALHGRVALLVRQGPVRDAITLACRDLGLEIGDALQPGLARLVFADSDLPAVRLEEIGVANVPVLIVPRRDDDASSTLAGLGVEYGELELPIAGRQTARLIRLAIDGGLAREAQTARTAAARKPVATYAGVNVLAVDDNLANLEVLAEALARFGVTVESVTSGADALKAIATRSFDLVFMDGSMPEMDGFEASRRIRALEQDAGRASMPIVALTAHVIGARADAWKEAGMSDYLAKPFTLAEIGACLARWLPSDRTAQQASSQETHANPADVVDAADELPLIDRTVLAAIAEMQAPGDNLVERVIDLFVTHAPEHLERLVEALDKGAPAIARAAHALKSLCRSIGAARLGGACEIVEAAANEGIVPQTAAISQLSALQAETIAALRTTTALAA